LARPDAVVGIDRNAQVLAVARERARARGLLHIDFAEASVDGFTDPRPFDLVIGRYVLVHQVDPVAFLHAAARFVRPGGIVALHELIADRPLHSLPHVALWQQTGELVWATFQRVVPSWDAGSRLIELFFRAGLPQPRLFSETQVGGGVDAAHYAWLADLARTLLPQMVQFGGARAEAVAIDTLESRLRAAVVDARSQVDGPAQICAWTGV
jgi:ubiquinone/menaquinone biosynthesis C-methylase UbiE